MRCPACGRQEAVGHFCTHCGARLPGADDQAAQPARPLPRWVPAGAAIAAAPPTGGGARRTLAAIAVGLLTLVGTACVVFLLVASVPDPVALGLSLLAAVVPAAIYGWLVLRLDRYEVEPGRVIAAAFGWGAVGAILFSVVGGLLFQWLLVAALAPAPATAGFLSVAVGAPLVEESFKGIALVALLLFFRHELDNVLDGIVYGALIGLGFAMTENVLYFGAAYLEGGTRDLGELFVARAVLNGFGHAAYTATTGAAVGWARGQYRAGAMRFVVPVLGWALAVLQHFLWNGGTFVVAGLLGENARPITVVLIQAPLIVLPALVVLYLTARLAGRRELAVIHRELEAEVARGTLTAEEYATLGDEQRRRQALREAARRGGRRLRDRQRRFFHVAAELAYRKYHLRRGEAPKPGQRAPGAAYREELAALRRELASAA